MTEERTFDWVPRHDPRSLNYPARAVARNLARPSRRQWTPGPILDQGREGACVGFGWTAEALATPVRVDLTRATELTWQQHDPDRMARSIYRRAQLIDEWEGENYEGTSVLAGAKAMREVRLLREFRWAFGVTDVIDAILTMGPVVLGTYWHEDMYEAPGGVLTPGGAIVGGHAYLATGYTPNGRFIDGPAITIQNSWGRSWGKDGIAEIKVSHLDALLRRDGEACVPSSRSYGR
jgi:hypothetical protein